MASILVSGDTSGSITISAPAVSGSSVLTLPTGTDTLVGKATTDTLTNKTVTAPVLSGTVTGTYTLGGTPTLTAPALGTPASGVLTNCTGTANSLNAGLGVNQTWQNVTASRAFGTTYTNSTGKPILVVIAFSYPGAGAAGEFTVAGVLIQFGQVNSAYIQLASGTAIVPAGATYVHSTTTTIYQWLELR